MKGDFSLRLDLDWSKWTPIAPPDDLKEIPRQYGGIYRVTHVDSGGIEYVGRSYTNLRYRIQKIDHRTEMDEASDGSSHVAAPHFERLKKAFGSGLLVSWIGIESSEVDRIDAIWAAYLSSYRAIVGRSPASNFGKTVRIPGELPDDGGLADSPFADLRSYESKTRPSLDWENWRDVTGAQWMGLNWTDPFDLSLPEDPDEWTNQLPATSGVYRTWKPESDVLDRIEATSNLERRIREKAENIGYESMIATCELDITGKPSRTEVEVDLLGAHYIATNVLPESDISDIDSVSEKAKRILNRSEDNQVEFKSSEFDNDSLAEEMVALANGGGGEIFIGVDNDGNSQPVSQLDQVGNTISNIASTSINPSLRISVRKPRIDGEQILWVKVDGAHSRLYSTKGSFLVRSGSTKRAYQWSDLERFLSEHPSVIAKIIGSEDFDMSELAVLQRSESEE